MLRNYFPAGMVGRDKLLNPRKILANNRIELIEFKRNCYYISVWVVRYGKADLKGILRSVKKKDYITHVVNLVESGMNIVYNNPEQYKRSPDALVQSCIIFDMDGFSMGHITYKPGIIQIH